MRFWRSLLIEIIILFCGQAEDHVCYRKTWFDSSPWDRCLPMALVSAAYAKLLPRHWQEMLIEHGCVVKWAHHKIVWPSQGFARRAVIFFISLQEQSDTLATGIQTIPSRLSCTTRFCLLWRLVKSRNLWIAMSLPVYTVCTSISARPFYTKISKPVVAYALGSLYLLCARTPGWCSYQSCLENPAAGFAKRWQKARAFTFVRHSAGELDCQHGW